MKKSYYYADGQILSQRVHDPVDPNSYTPYFYVHDRLGSVRMVVDDTGAAVCSYTYRPYGAFYDGECVETAGVDNPWKFTGQYYDAEIEQYYLRARQYDPKMMRFTSRDPVRGKYQEPLTLHKYLYCINSPTYGVDWTGKFSIPGLLVNMSIGTALGAIHGFASGLIALEEDLILHSMNGMELTDAEFTAKVKTFLIGGTAIGATGGLLAGIGGPAAIRATFGTKALIGEVSTALLAGAFDAWADKGLQEGSKTEEIQGRLALASLRLESVTREWF
ncbi:RHS repeat domain-containing protein [Anaerohalosphaeraceae bacterium U12dextr]